MYYIGVDVGGTNIATGVMNEEGKLIKKVSVKALGNRTPQEITGDVYKSIEAVMKEAEITENDFEYIGVGIPGCVDNTVGKIILTENMNLSDFEFVKELQKYINKPVYMANDANCAVYGEMMAGAATGCSNVVMITIGTGVGGGFVINKNIYEGTNGAAMEVGHMVIDNNGIICNCGRPGCWEKYASATALVRITKEYMEKYPDSLMHTFLSDSGEVNGMTAFKAARANDEAGMKVVDVFAEYLAVGIANLINLFQPEVVLVGGGVSNEGDFLLDRVRAHIKKTVYAYEKIPSTVIKKADLGNDAGIIGAGFLGI